MAEQKVSIDAPVTVTGNVTTTPVNTSTTPLFVTQTTAPGALIYTTLIENVPSVNGTLNLLSIFNPVGSGKSIVFGQFVCFPYATGATTTTTNMDVFRISAASGGTQLAAANINKFNTSQANSIAEVRTGNPTFTTVGTVPVLAIPPAVTSAAAGASSTANIIPPTGALFVCAPGEGVGCRIATTTVNQIWTLGFTWAEM